MFPALPTDDGEGEVHEQLLPIDDRAVAADAVGVTGWEEGGAVGETDGAVARVVIG